MFDAETPRHLVKIERPFAIGRYEVTRSQYSAFVEASGYGPGTCAVETNYRIWVPDPVLDWRNPGYAHNLAEATSTQLSASLMRMPSPMRIG